ncbi:right-handed parallel beta-helix repeat-containing protein, partial [bacterium]|nr:right-handed parallel beta-helix repeat-containing protein [bacterium]
ATYNAANHTLTWNLGMIGAGWPMDSKSFITQITADSGTCIANYAQISADNADTVYSDTIIHKVVGAVGCADIIYVNDSTGSDTNDGLDTATAKKTISAGVEAVCSGGTVYVAAGTYTEMVYINKRIALIGQGTPTIKPPSSANGVTFGGAATDGALISGFRITGATGDWPNGIGIWCENGAEPTIINNIIIGNAYHGIHCDNSSPNITNNTIAENAWDGIHPYNSSPSITNNTITGNSWGISCDNSSPIITNNTIAGNSAHGILCGNSSPFITNNIIVQNGTTSTDYYGIYNSGGNPTINYNCVWGNGTNSPTTNYYNCSPGPNDISLDPQFIGGDDYHLQASSPCIDKGTNSPPGGLPSTDKDGNPRPYNGGIADMGAYEYQGTPYTCTVTANAGSGDTICLGTCTTLNGLASSGTPPYIYSWSPITGLDDPNTCCPMACPDTTTTYTLTVTYNNGCTATDTVTVTVNLPPTANAGADDTICSGSCTTLNGSASGGSPDYTYSWTSSPAGFTSNDSITTVCPATTTIYTLTVTDSNGCTDTDQVVVTVLSPIANAGADVSVCSGNCTTLNGSATGGSGNYGYSWSPATGLSNPNIAKPQACPTVTTTYTLTVTDNTCETTDIDQVSVTVNPCIVSLGLTKSSSPAGETNCTKKVYQESIITYTLSYRSLGDARAVNVKIVDYLDTGLSPLTYPGGTYNSSDHTITWNLGSLNYYDHGTRGITCRVVASPGSCLSNYAAISADNFAPIATGFVKHQVIGQLTGLTLSKSSDPAGDANCARQVLKGETIIYTLNYEWSGNVQASRVKITDYLDPDLAPISYPGGEYDPLNHTLTYDLSTLDPGDSNSLVFTAEVTADSGTCIANYAAISSNNAQAVTSDTITHYVIIPLTADAGADVTVCSGSCAVLGGLPSAAGGVSPYTYLWNPGGQSGANPQVCPTATTTYILTITDNDGQTDEDQVVITVNPSPTANAGANTNICSGDCATLSGSATGGTGPYTYTWNPGGLTGQNPSACPTATTTYTVTVTDANGCSDTDQTTITVNPSPTANAGADASICSGDCAVLNGSATGGTGPYTYLWTPGNIPAQNPEVCPTATTTYTLTVT